MGLLGSLPGSDTGICGVGLGWDSDKTRTPQVPMMEGGIVSSRCAGLGATLRDGWTSDTGSDTGTCGIGLGWDSTWDNDKLMGPSTGETG